MVKYLFCIWLVLSGCSVLTLSSGGEDKEGSASETVGFSGRLVDDNGKRVVDAKVELFALEKKIPVLVDSTRTNNNGIYTFASVSKGKYQIEGTRISEMDTLRFHIHEIHIESDLVSLVNTMKAPGTIVGRVDSGATIYRVSLYETGYSTLSDAQGNFSLSNIPEGEYEVCIQLQSIASGCIDLYRVWSFSGRETRVPDIQVQAQGSVQEFDEWSHHAKLFINTASSGLDLQENLVGYPVLLRLDENDIDFSTSSERGVDVRFTNESGTKLSYEIHLWDELQEKALLWVRLDTLYSNRKNQYINMYWGKENVHDESNGQDVFVVQDGFVGAWHLDDTQVYKDETGNESHGTAINNVYNAQGLIGRGIEVQGDGSRIEFPHQELFNFTGAFTLSIWFKVDGFAKLDEMFLGKGSRQWRLKRTSRGDDTVNTEAFNFAFNEEGPDGGIQTWIQGKKTISDGTWHLLTGLYDGQFMKVYTDGKLERIREFTGIRKVTTSPVSVGGPSEKKRGNFNDFTGYIDEVRISDVARSDAWIQMNYQLQRPDTSWIRIEIQK